MRLYCRPIKSGLMELSGPQAHHALGVMRLRGGAEVELFDGKGVLAQATVREVGKKKLLLEVGPAEVIGPRTTGRIVLAVSLAKGERFDWLISKATELGADHIAPVIYERTVKLSRGPGALARWERLAVAAAQQCHRLYLPRLEQPANLERTLAWLQPDYPQAQWLVGSLTEQAHPLLEVLQPDRDAVAFVGPEGGLTSAEEATLLDRGATPVRLTEHTLRIETAAIAFAALLAAARQS